MIIIEQAERELKINILVFPNDIYAKNYCTKLEIELTDRPVRDLNTGPLAT